jgi:hypothetical protein
MMKNKVQFHFVLRALIGLCFLQGLIDTAYSAMNGKIVLYNVIGDPYNYSHVSILHYSDASELRDKFDKVFYPMFNPEGQASKIVSEMEDPNPIYKELIIDVRPLDSLTPVYCEASLISSGNDPLYPYLWFNRFNYLRFYLPNATDPSTLADFYDKSLTLQFTQMDRDPNLVGKVYDLRKEIILGNGTGVINFPDFDTVYESGYPYCKFTLFFDRKYADFNNDGKVNLEDLSILLSEFGTTGNRLADIAISDPGNTVLLSAFMPNTTPYYDGVVDLADLIEFSKYWLVGYRK